MEEDTNETKGIEAIITEKTHRIWNRKGQGKKAEEEEWGKLNR